MTQKWDEIKKKVSDIASQAASKAGELTRDAAEKAEEVTKLGKIKLDLFQLKKDKDKQFQKIGSTIYTLLNDGKYDVLLQESDISTFIDKVKEIDIELKTKEEKYQKIKNEHSVKKEEASDIPEEENINSKNE